MIAIAATIAGHDNRRLLVAFNKAADQEPERRALFSELTDGFFARLTLPLERFGLDASEDRVDLLHTLFVGLSVIDLATRRPRGEERSRATLGTAFRMMATTTVKDG